MNDRRYLELADENGTITRIAYFDSGTPGPILLFLHGFAECACTWEPLLELLPAHYRVIRPDFKGFGNSSVNDPEHLSLYDQTRLMEAFLCRLELTQVTLIGHSMGGAIAALLVTGTEKKRFEQLILIDAAGMSERRPDFVESLAGIGTENPLLRFGSEDLMAYLVMRQAYLREEKISPELLNCYAEALRRPGGRECVIAAARQFRISNVAALRNDLARLKLPALILWGAEDRIIPLEHAERFQHCLAGAKLVIFPDCGHSPQEEIPEECVAAIVEFLGETPPAPLPETVAAEVLTAPGGEIETTETSVTPTLTSRSFAQLRQLRATYNLRMHRLFDRWSFGTLILLVFIKLLQLLKKFGMRAEENGWRKATGIFLRNEYSKFVLSCFRLTYCGSDAPEEFTAARGLFLHRLEEFIRNHGQLHWSASPGVFRLGRRKNWFTDIAEAFYDHNGDLLWIELHLDSGANDFQVIDRKRIQELIRFAVYQINRRRTANGRYDAESLARRLRQHIKHLPGVGYAARQELRTLIDRLLSATFIHCELLPECPPDELSRRRLASPNLRRYRNPGWGLLNVIARFTADFREVDLWLQYHHVPVDGMPMQELIAELKSNWGVNGKLFYPSLDSPAGKRPEIVYAGDRLFRSRFFLDFSGFLAVRRELNQKYASLMEGPATVAGIVIWGLAQHPYFRDCKVLFPVDMESEGRKPEERELSLVFIRARRYLERGNPLGGFLNFQKEFNQRLWRTRRGESESYELLELYSMIHPLFYQIGHRFLPFAMGELVGTMGLSVLKDSEIFISPLSDLQTNGFITLGGLSHPTEDGKTAGAVCVCGSRDQIRYYHEAMAGLTGKLRRLLQS